MLQPSGLRKKFLILILVCAVLMAQPGEVRGVVSGDPSFLYVEFNGERKWPGQTHIVEHGIMLRIVAALDEPHEQSMKADLIIIDENDDARILRMKIIESSDEKEWHEYRLDTNTLNPGPYKVRIRAWNMALEDTAEHEGITSEEVVWGDLYLSLQAQQATRQPPGIPGFPWEAIGIGSILAAVSVIMRRKREPRPVHV